ncbi:MAG: PEP-CTERM sorting domain-containing protein [Verrucomicrobiota bacterium]
MNILKKLCWIGIAAAPLWITATAGTNGFYIPTFRGQPGTTSSLWETFTVPTGAPGNRPNFGNDLSPVLTQLTPGALITGTGNIYNMAEASAFTISYASGSGPLGLVVLQTRTFGTELDYNSVRLTYDGGSLMATRTETDRVQVGAPGTPGSGVYVSSAWQWDLSGRNVGQYSISFNAAEHSLSFDSALLDVQAVPEPGTLALMAIGAGFLVGGLRRRR